MAATGTLPALARASRYCCCTAGVNWAALMGRDVDMATSMAGRKEVAFANQKFKYSYFLYLHASVCNDF